MCCTPPSRRGTSRRCASASASARCTRSTARCGARSSIFEGTVAAPFSFYNEVLATGTYVPESTASFWEASLRYVVGSTVGCYFAAPVEERSDTQGAEADGETSDGEPMKILRPSAEKMCFPAWPYLIPQIGTFRVLTNTVGVDFYELTYAKYCMEEGAADTLARTIDDLNVAGYTAVSNDAIFPNAPLLRVAEGGDAIANAVRSGETSASAAASAFFVQSASFTPPTRTLTHLDHATHACRARRGWADSSTHSSSLPSPSSCSASFRWRFLLPALLRRHRRGRHRRAGPAEYSQQAERDHQCSTQGRQFGEPQRNHAQGLCQGRQGLAKNSLVAKNARLLYKGGKGAYRAAKAAPGAYRAAKAKVGEARAPRGVVRPCATRRAT